MTKEDLFNLYSTVPNDTYHGNVGWTVQMCVDDTWSKIQNHELYLYDFGYFSIDRDGDIVPYLGGFFIKPECRNIENKQLLYKEICSKMPGIFLSSIHNTNEKAIRYLCQCPGSEIVTVTEKYTYFVFRQGSK